MSDWSPDWQTGNIEGMGEVDIHNQLRLSLKEKQLALGGSGSAALPIYTTAVQAGDIPRKGLISTIPVNNNDWYKEFEWRLDRIITHLRQEFVNHEDSGGDWQGQTVIPRWTKVSLLSSLGESRLPIPGVGDLLRPWTLQQYKILEKLRWVKDEEAEIYQAFRRTGISNVEPSESEAKDVATDEWDGNSWTSVVTSAEFERQSSIIQQSPTNFKAQLLNLVYKLRQENLAHPAIKTSSADFYQFVEAAKHASGASGSEIFESPDGFSEDVYNKISSTGEGTQYTVTAEFGTRTKTTFETASLGDDNRRGQQGVTSKDRVSIQEFEGIDGFQYADWF